MTVNSNDNPVDMIDKPYSLRCPHCGANSNLSVVSTPRWAQICRYRSKKVIVGFRCDACHEPIALKFRTNENFGSASVKLSDEYEELERPIETFEYQHLPKSVGDDFREALACYSHGCLNATAAMCRRTIQSAAEFVGVTGTSKVRAQIAEAKDIGKIDDETYSALEQIILTGHDGSHPHLPTITEKRADILVEIMKDVLYQLIVRTSKIGAAAKLREDAIDEKREAKKA